MEFPRDPIALRKFILKKRKELSESERILRFNKILNQFYKTPRYKRSKHILAYYGISRNAEFNTLGLMEKILHDGKHLYLTRCVPNQIQLEIYEIFDPINDLEPGQFKIMEPKPSLKKIELFESLDIIIVPGLVFDHLGMRYGYGKGYYDSLLGKPSLNHALKVSFALSFSVMDFQLKSHKLDVPMDMIITENEKIIMKSE
ncbi:5-formyltetrahydrofolate cyclo-ligase [Promethearchaeum syntrophicum]|uniref:5-formyltetrahydrofolate cyclo-ligase n=1 Tax=Promethearchaeum syntrophicum TaxID=2594042 RepID=A0A5B9DGD3_9ARCH|nr:5-formyltetrahydrofolate cyclo-ligase [Candidatus Prometheoarchaeum syntrophicum]